MGNKIYESSMLQKYSSRSWDVNSPGMCCRELPGTGGDRSPRKNVLWFQFSWVLLCMECEGVFVLWAGWLEYGKGEIMALKKIINIPLLTATAQYQIVVELSSHPWPAASAPSVPDPGGELGIPDLQRSWQRLVCSVAAFSSLNQVISVIVMEHSASFSP